MLENVERTDRKVLFGRESTITLCGCLVLSALICVGQIMSSSILIVIFLAVSVLLCIWSCMKEKIFSVLLYFLPWSPLMKFYIGGISFFTVMLLVSCFVALIKNKMLLNIYQIVLAAFIAIITVFAKMIHENPIANSYLFFLAMLLLLPCITKNIGMDSFNEVTVFLRSV